MTDVAEKEDPEKLELNAKPRPVTRLSRPALIAIAAGALILIFAAMMIALKPPKVLRGHERTELYNVKTKPTAEGLETLPKSYDDLEPDIGAPLPGDLGSAILDAEQALGVQPQPFRPTAEDQAARNEAMRQAQMKIDALESNVFFQLSQQGSTQAKTSFASLTAENPLADGGTELNALAEQIFETSPSQEAENETAKLAFLGPKVDTSIYNPHRVQDPISPHQLMAGTVIPASLLTGINSDLPGAVIAQVTQHVYDTVTGQHVLVPQGARLMGKYDDVVAFGQKRALVVWNRIVNPDGTSIVIENAPATDAAGYAGLADKVDFHTFQLLKGVILSTLLGVSTELSLGDSEGDIVEAIRESAQNSINQAGQKIVERELNVQPTITVRPGWPVRVIVNKDLVLRPYIDDF